MNYLLVLLFTIFSLSSLVAQDYVQEIEQHREAYKQQFMSYEQSPLDSSSPDLLQFYPADDTYRLSCEVAFNENTKDVVTISTYAGKEKQYLKHARFTCPLGSDTIQLVAYRSVRHLRHPVYSKQLFIPFKDYTNGEETYGGGRYIDFPMNDIHDGKAILDLNKAYNPWCAYADGYNCPIPPKENHLLLKIEAGEQAFKK